MCFCVSRFVALFLKSTLSFTLVLSFFNFFILKRGKFYSRNLLFRSPKGNGKKFEIAGFRNNRGSVKGKGKSKEIRSSFEIAGTSN